MRRTKIKGVSIALCGVLLLASCGGTVQKTENDTTPKYEYIFRNLPEPTYIEAAESFSGGNGTETDPYQISTAAELALMSELTNDEDFVKSREYNKANYKLTADISLNDTSNADDWSNTAPQYSWKPISQQDGLMGSFDGDGHTISGLYINIDCSDNNCNMYGLFAKNYGSISNLNITDSYICVSGYNSYIGSICGWNYGIITNCESSVDFEYYDATIGGIAGCTSRIETINENGGIISDCAFKGSIKDKRDKSFSYAGGIAGSLSSNAQLKNCHNYSDITAEYENSNTIGGIAASCSNSTIDSCTNSGNISANDDAGGILASTSALNDSEIVYINNCVNEGAVYGTGDFMAGILASGSGNVKISGCKNNGEVTGKDGVGSYAAGIIANAGADTTIENCENTGYVHSNIPAGIVSQTIPMNEISISIKNNINSGKIVSTGLYSGGIVNYINIGTDKPVKIDIQGCVNKGYIESQSMAGGIVAFSSNAATSENSEESYLKITACKNEGDIYTHSGMGVVGGVIGSYGLNDFRGEIIDCENSGNITFAEIEPDEETTSIAADDPQQAVQLTRMGGGIVGKIGDSIDLFQIKGADNNNPNINAEDAILKISGCRSTGAFVSPAEEDYAYDDNGVSVITNNLGGIVGYSSQKDGYSFKAENCFFSGIEYGLGNNYGTDIGTKEN